MNPEEEKLTVVDLANQVTGEGRPLVILHGLFGAARNWASIARGLADMRQVHALDLRNHGNSAWADDMRYESMAADVAAYVDRHGLAPCDILGHSMGGKAAMVLALSRPELVDRLIIVDIAPVPYQRDSFRDYVAAMQAVDLDRVTKRAAIDGELASAIPDTALRAFLMQNLAGTDGKYRWRLNLAGIADNLPAIIDFPGLPTSFEGPTTFIAGERSDYIRPRDAAAIRHLFPHAKLLEIGDSGHWPHAEHPDRFLAMVRVELG